MLSASGLTSSSLTTQVVHEGYLRARATSKGKQERDRRILSSAIDRDPDDLYLRFKLLEQARFWGDNDLLEQTALATVAALADPKQALANDLPRVPWGGELLTLLAEGVGRTPDDQLDLLTNWSPAVQTGPALLLRRAELLEQVGRLDEAADVFRSCLDAQDDGTIQRTTSRPLLGLVRIALLQGNTEEARVFCRRALDCAPDDPEARYAAQMLLQ
jgi:tetratricopeptide (TPR) repeat protein